jgi:hypothetical protein
MSWSKNKSHALTVMEPELKIPTMSSPAKTVEDKVKFREESILVEGITTCSPKLVPDAREKVKSLAGNVMCASPKKSFQVLNNLRLK